MKALWTGEKNICKGKKNERTQFVEILIGNLI